MISLSRSLGDPMFKSSAARFGACALFLTTALASAHPALAQASAPASAQVAFDIPAGNAAEALNLFSRQAGVQILFPYDVAARHVSVAVKGRYGREQALRLLIAGSSLEIASADASVITLRARADGSFPGPVAQNAEVEELIVTSRAGTDARTRLATSYAVTTLNEAQLRMRSPTGVADALKSVPGFWVEASGGEASANIRARGIPQEGYSAVALYEDGAPVQHDSGLGYLNADQAFRIDETVERMEVVRGGPSSIFASYAPGGTVNFITRKGGAHPEGLVKVQAGDYGMGRVDGWYGGPIGDWRFGVGGFYRQDDGVRDPGYTADKGGQIRVTLGRDFDKGSIDFNVRHLDDHVILFAGIPLKFDSNSGQPSAVPGFDPNYGTLNGPETARLTLRSAKGPFDWDLTKGTAVKLTEFTASLNYEIVDGWKVTDVLRYSTAESRRIGLFPNTPVTGTARLAQYRAQLLAAVPGATDVQLRYATSPSQVFDVNGQNGNGLVLDGSLRWVSAPLDQTINDLRLLHKFNVGGQVHDVAFGFYTALVSESFNRYSANALLDVRDNARRLDLVAVDAAGKVLYSATENGVSRYGAEFANGTGDSKTFALYASDEWHVTDDLRIDLGVRWESIDFTGRSERTTSVNLNQSPSLADDNVLTGSGVYDTVGRNFQHTGWTIGADWQFARGQGVFGRYTKAFRLPSLGDYITNAANTSPFVQTMDLAEAGYKLSIPKLDLYATAFYTKYNALTFGSLVFNPVTGGYDNQTSITDTKTYGIELEGTYRPARWFDVAFNATFQNPEFGDYAFDETCTAGAPAAGAVPACGANGHRIRNFTGNQLIRAPKQSFRLTPGVNLMDDRLRLQVDVEYYGQRYSDAANTSILPDYTLVNAAVRFDATPRLTLYAYGSNLTNEIGLTEGNPRAGQIISSEAGSLYGVGRPELGRSFKVAALYRF